MVYKKLFFPLFLLSILYCASHIKSGNGRQPGDWTIHHPVSSTHFIGVGCAKMGAPIDDAQRAARNMALEDISSQIKVRVEGNTVVEQTQTTVNGETTDASLFNEKVKTYTESILEGVETAATKVTPEGKYCVQLSLNKAAYYAKLNENINRARVIAIDGLIAAEKADPIGRVYELLSSLKSIDGFTASLLKCRVNNEEVILNTEILRRLRQALDDIQITPVIPDLTVGALDTLPDTIGFYLSYNNIPVENCPLTWSASNNGVTVLPLAERQQGFYPVRVSGLSASVGKVTISSSVDFLKIRDDLKKLGLRIPFGSFVLSRTMPSVFATGKSEFIESLVNELLNSNTFSMALSAELADYTITGALTIDPDVIVQRSIFQASGMLECTLNIQGTIPVAEIRRKATAGNGRSKDAAVQSLKKEAVGIAVKEIAKIF